MTNMIQWYISSQAFYELHDECWADDWLRQRTKPRSQRSQLVLKGWKALPGTGDSWWHMVVTYRNRLIGSKCKHNDWQWHRNRMKSISKHPRKTSNLPLISCSFQPRQLLVASCGILWQCHSACKTFQSLMVWKTRSKRNKRRVLATRKTPACTSVSDIAKTTTSPANIKTSYRHQDFK